MAMTTAFLNLIVTYAGTQVGYIGLVDAGGTELTGGSPAYARKAVTWAAAASGTIRPNADLTFDIPAGVTVGGWKAYTAATAGTCYDGANLTNEVFAGQGTYKLLASGTGIVLSAS